jgi:hypothetical protein
MPAVQTFTRPVGSVKETHTRGRRHDARRAVYPHTRSACQPIRWRRTAARSREDFHTDGADVIGPLCLRGAKRGGERRIVSSISVVNAIGKTHPELVPVLFRDFYWHYFEPEMPSPVHSPVPSAGSRAAD